VASGRTAAKAPGKVTAKQPAKPGNHKALPAKQPGKAAAPAATKPSAKPAAPATVQARPSAAVHSQSSPAATPFKGKVASAVAMVTPRVATATARHAPPKTQKTPQSAMNNPAVNSDNGVTREDGRYALPATVNIELPKGYRPSNDEEYMSPRHLAYFRNKLRDWRDQLVEESRQTMENLRDEVRDVGDEAERATRETENSLELRTRDRYRKLISKIDKALRRIEEGRYGYCEETDEEIGIDRLDARPIATLSLDAQERREHLQKQMGD
jgi:DnaK suppressor protein